MTTASSNTPAMARAAAWPGSRFRPAWTPRPHASAGRSASGKARRCASSGGRSSRQRGSTSRCCSAGRPAPGRTSSRGRSTPAARRAAPFVKVNCAAVPHDLLESELFGHERGAFTGAHQRRSGSSSRPTAARCSSTRSASCRSRLQAKLLRILQDGEFGASAARPPVRVDVRVVAATNREPERAVAEGEFRQDLYYRLNVMPLMMPPLRERLEEIPLLVEHFARRYAAQYNRAEHDPRRVGRALSAITTRATSASSRTSSSA